MPTDITNSFNHQKGCLRREAEGLEQVKMVVEREREERYSVDVSRR